MNVTRLSTLIIVLCCFQVRTQAQRLSPAQKEILSLQDQRSLGEGRLVGYLQNKDKDLRYRTAIALANIQDTSTVAPLLPLLQDVDIQVRAAAAFALGQIGTSTAQKALVGALASEQDVTVLSRVFEALGKCGDEQALNLTISYIPSGRNIAIKRDQALSLARFALRKVKSDRAVLLCYDLLNDNHTETRLAASYALWRFEPMNALDLEISRRPDVIQKLMNDKSEDVRINVAAMLGRTKSGEAPGLVKLFCEVESTDPDWRVQVQLARAATTALPADPALLKVLLEFLVSTNDHVRIATLTALGQLPRSDIATSSHKDKLAADLQTLSTTPSRGAELVQGEAIVTFARLFPESFTAEKASIVKTLRTGLLWSTYIEALSWLPDEVNLRYVLHCLADDTLRIRMAAWEFIPRMLRSFHDGALSNDSLSSILVTSMHTSLARRDMALTTLVAGAVTDSAVLAVCERAGFGAAIAGALRDSYGGLSSDSDVEAMLALQASLVQLKDTAAASVLERSLEDPARAVAQGAARALHQLTGRVYPPPTRDSSIVQRSERDWKALEAIPPGQRIAFKTTKGTFTIRVRKDAAPFTVLAICELVKKKFYDGLTFHRVVPDFVIQGGDPRGDGWGGPGFTIRSEWSLVNFTRGAVGLASSGKDTEGSQFFITHVATPHLDGKYTVFANVVSGMDVVDKIQVGDKILKAELR